MVRSFRFLIIILVWVACLPMLQARSLTFEERVTAQWAIEDVYWRHRIWPENNPDPKPPLEKVLPESAIRAKVEDSLRMSRALEQIWQRPITARDLQSEMERIARETRQSETLAELFSALGDDPFLIAECLVRPILADRLLSERCGSDRDSVNGCPSVVQLSSSPAEISVPSGEYARVTPSSTLSCQDDTWTPTSVSSPPPARFGHAASWTGSEMIVWGGCNGGPFPLNNGKRYDPATNSWTTITTTPPGYNGGCGLTAVWTGSRMIVWGGGYNSELGAQVWNTGGRYDPASNSWTATSTGAGVPSARWEHTSIWTGTRMVVWGGYSSCCPLGTGGQYDPASDTWSPTGIGLICSGGPNDGHSCQGDADCPGTCSGGVDPGGTCVPSGGPAACAGGCQQNPAVHCTSNTLCRSANLGNCINPPPGTCTNAGSCQTPAYAPSGRYDHSAVWTGSRMIVWGGSTSSATNTGALYDPAFGTWTPTSAGANVPSARSQHGAVWTGSEMIVWGGYYQGGETQTGGRYDPVNNSWTPTSTGANVPPARASLETVWTGSEMIVWGGSVNNGGVRVNTGGRYNPASDTWTPTSTGANVPAAREGHSAVWTGSEMIVWGGLPSGVQSTGGRYCAASACQVATWYRDADGDGYGNSSDPVLACTQPAGYAAAGGDCNEANGSVHPNAIELCDGIDNNCDGTTDNPAPPDGSAAVSAQFEGGMTELSWTSLAGATGYDLVRGSVSTLAGSHGNFTLATDACLANDLAATNKSEPGIPAAGEGVWYLVRGTNCGGAGTYDSGATSQVGPRDAEIQASPSACP